MNRLQFLLMKLAEEASEVSQIALKNVQFGTDERYGSLTNAERCHNELNDLLTIVSMLNKECDFGFQENKDHQITKRSKVDYYYGYSKHLGMVKK